jgi:hypothetical protein
MSGIVSILQLVYEFVIPNGEDICQFKPYSQNAIKSPGLCRKRGQMKITLWAIAFQCSPVSCRSRCVNFFRSAAPGQGAVLRLDRGVAPKKVHHFAILA